PSRAAYGLVSSRRILHERTRAHDATVTLRVVDDPPDRPDWLRETIRLLVDASAAGRRELLDRVAAASDADLAAGTDDDWGLGQVATHLLIVERGSVLIGLRLAQGALPGPTGQPRPAAAAVTRTGIAGLAEKTAAAAGRRRPGLPPPPPGGTGWGPPSAGRLDCLGSPPPVSP